MSLIVESRVADDANRLPAAFKKSTVRFEWLAWSICIAASTPLAALHLRQLWDKPHYDFAPLLLAALGYCAWQRWNDDASQAMWMAMWCARWLRIGSLLCLLVAIALFSPSLGYIAFLLGLGSLVVRITGSAFGGALGPVWSLAWLLVPPPLALDVRLVQGLQARTAWLASQVLDLLGHKHFLEGNILEFAGHSFFVEEACSGVQSLFSLIAVALLFALWKRRSCAHGLLLAVAAVFWALVVNVLRILIIGLVYTVTGDDIASGPPHELLGFTLFGMAVALLLSTDQLIGFVLGPIIVPYGMATRNRFSRRWNRLIVAGLHRHSGRATLNRFSRRWNRWVANAPAEKARSAMPAEIEAATETNDEAVASQSCSAPRTSLVCAYAALGLVQLVVLTGTVARTSTAIDLPEGEVVAAAALPESLNDWQRTDSKLEERARESNEGHYSRNWAYTGPGYVALVSCDYPFAFVHELPVCYVSKGWQVSSRKIVSCAWPAGIGELCEVEMVKAGGESAYLLFVEFDREGRPANLNLGAAWSWPRVQHRLWSSPLAQTLRKGPLRVNLEPNTLYQFQVFVPTITPLSAAQRCQVREQFDALLGRLLSQWPNEKQGEAAG